MDQQTWEINLQEDQPAQETPWAFCVILTMPEDLDIVEQEMDKPASSHVPPPGLHLIYSLKEQDWEKNPIGEDVDRGSFYQESWDLQKVVF